MALCIQIQAQTAVETEKLKGKKTAVIPKISNPIVIDGKVDEEVWQKAVVLKDFIQISPGDNIAPSKKTEVLIAYDEKHLYFAFKCWDERDKIRATVARRDQVFDEDNVRVWLDTYNDQRRAYILGFNPLGIQQDAIYTEGEGNDNSFDIVMESKGVIQDWGWSVEAKIPFKSLRYASGDVKTWGFNVYRNIARLNDEFDSWMPFDRNISGRLNQHGLITGISGINVERTLEIVPSITLKETGSRVQTVSQNTNETSNDRFVNQPINADVGVTLKVGITPNITLDAAINPDFAEIEADAPVVRANQRFPIFFEEKRPFFLEGVEIFQSPLQVFYSRTIVDPDFATKLTGKVGKNSFGFLVASDNAPGNFSEDDRNNPDVRPRINEFLDKNAMFGIVRLKRDVGKENDIGLFGTMRTFPEQKNFLGGFDGRFKLNPKTIISFQVVGTHSRRCFLNPFFETSVNPFQVERNEAICDGETFEEYRTGNGVGYVWNLNYEERNGSFFVEATGRSKDYRADAGFTRRTDTNLIRIRGSLRTDSKPESQIIRTSWSPYSSFRYDWKGRSQEIDIGNQISFDFQRNTEASFGGGVFFERFFETEFGLSRTANRNGAFLNLPERSSWQQYFSAEFETKPYKRVDFEVSFDYVRNAFDFDSGEEPKYSRASPAYLQYLINRQSNPNLDEPLRDPGIGNQIDFKAELELKPTDPFVFKLEYRNSRFTRKDTGRKTFIESIYSLRSTYQFTRFIFIRNRLDYNTLSSRGRGQFLFGYTPNPGTAFFAGYNDNFNFNGYNPFTGAFESGYKRNNRTFFIRATYLFRKSF